MHLIEKVTGKTRVQEFSDLTNHEQEQVIAELKNYARHCMDEYAANFYREKVKSGNDLVWFGRVDIIRETLRKRKMVEQSVEIRNQDYSFMYT